MQSWIIKTAWCILGIISLILIISFLAVYTATHPKKRQNDITPEDVGLGYENASFKTKDGLTLRGWFIASKTNKTIIVLHGYPFNKANILEHARFLHPTFQLFFFDFRAMGESDGTASTGGAKEQEDLKQAIQYIKTRKDVGDIGIYGFSMGASVALLGATDDIKAIVADSGYSSLSKLSERMFPYSFAKWPFVWTARFMAKIYGVDAKKADVPKSVSKLHMPILFIHGTKDSQIPHADTVETFSKANEPKELWLIEGADHGSIPDRKEYEERIRNFFYLSLK
ncbi:MAG: alpha/beta fold hydrolase [Candidatus Woesearchaeota archaeon]